MSDVYRHGIYTQELDTAMTPMISVNQPIFVVGTAMSGAVNEPKLISSLSEYKAEFGYDGDYSKYTLDEAADVCFGLYNVSPIICVNVYDREGKHVASTTVSGGGGDDPEP